MVIINTDRKTDMTTDDESVKILTSVSRIPTVSIGPGVWSVNEITPEYAKEVISEVGEFTSAIGHEATAVALSEILGVDVQVNRIPAALVPGDVAICLKLNGRLPEGEILSLESLQKIGFTLYEMVLHPFDVAELNEMTRDFIE